MIDPRLVVAALSQVVGDALDASENLGPVVCGAGFHVQAIEQLAARLQRVPLDADAD